MSPLAERFRRRDEGPPDDAATPCASARYRRSARSTVEHHRRRRGTETVIDLGLQGKRAFVSGSTAGIGLAIASALAAEGASVTINGRTQKRVDEAIAENPIRTPVGTRRRRHCANLGTEAGAKTLAAALPAVDILVNNLGIFEPKPFDEIPDEDWRRFFEVNVLSGVASAALMFPA